MKVELITRREDLAPLVSRWDELALNDPRDGFFRTSGWYMAWMRHIRPDAQPFVIVVRNVQGHVVGLAPLCRFDYRDLGFRLPGVAWAGRDLVSGDFLDFVAETGSSSEILQAILNFLWTLRAKWSLLILGELIERGHSDCELQRLAERNKLPFRRQEQRLCPYIILPSSFEEYLNSLGSSTRYHVRRRSRDVEKKGARVEVYSDPQEIAEHLPTLVRLHLARWHRDNLPGTFGRPGFIAFLREICTNPPAHSAARLYLLVHQGATLGALLTFYFGESALYYQAGWDPDSSFAALSPGVVLMAHSIRDAIANKLVYYEFLRGDEVYKSRWTKTFRTTTTVLVARSFFGKEYLRVARMKDLVKQHLGIGMNGNRHSADLGADTTGEPSDDRRSTADHQKSEAICSDTR